MGIEIITKSNSLRKRFFLLMFLRFFHFLLSHFSSVFIIIGHMLNKTLRWPNLLPILSNSVWAGIKVFRLSFYMAFFILEVFHNFNIITLMFISSFYEGFVTVFSRKFEILFMSSFQMTIFLKRSTNKCLCWLIKVSFAQVIWLFENNFILMSSFWWFGCEVTWTSNNFFIFIEVRYKDK